MYKVYIFVGVHFVSKSVITQVVIYSSLCLSIYIDWNFTIVILLKVKVNYTLYSCFYLHIPKKIYFYRRQDKWLSQ